MKSGFEVQIKKDDFIRTITLEEIEITIGNSYINTIPLGVGFDSFKLLELKDNSIKLYWDKNLKVELSRGGEKKLLDNILSYVSSRNYIEVRDDVNIIVHVSKYELSFKVIKLQEKYLKHVPRIFSEDIITKDNFGFISLFMALTFIVFLSVNSIMKNTKDLNMLEYNSDLKSFALNYKKAERKDKNSYSAKKNYESIKEVKGGKVIKDSKNIGSTGGFFDGEAIVSKGVLAVDKGAENVLVTREKSLFSKIDETIQTKPVKGYRELTNMPGQTFSTQRKFETARLDAIKEEKLLVSQNKNIQLEKPEKLKSDLNIKNVQILKGKRPETEIISVIGRHKKGFEFLYIEERKKDQLLQGRLVLKIEITSKGIVANAEIIDTDIQNKEFIQKIIFLIKSIRFPDSDYGDTIVKIPLVFLPA